MDVECRKRRRGDEEQKERQQNQQRNADEGRRTRIQARFIPNKG